ncbi:unnamed protein product [Penicillium nalgiovense]|uniref:Mitochondrial distribution and morphology protein 10 n=1 Tax=Penicillium nalgiovense TaxID=60175 RepID=A0A1V6Z4D1_PENNA|nr:hypothetical protein PENNAL_c0004G03320 [Penicillium nalgiovense]CAG7946858.1 unnamed protein product [Penicillium nalgiovense]CAG7949999.1 unnamed protein product [Penicillium nalgiovense]CAG7967988.1 unnamed protein product [Penicillium nalgiovense]CAG8025419.1 unnamed protein product [Penicillium nalgiovense]
MLDFMDYIQLSFAEATHWNRDNSYSSLNTTAQSILDFSTPERLRVHLSSLSTPHFATSYTLGTVGLLDGSVSYLFSTVPFNNLPSGSASIPLRKISPGYRQVQAPAAPIETWGWDSLLDGVSIPGLTNGSRPELPIPKDEESIRESEAKRKATLLHASLHLPPPSTLYALFLRRISTNMQLSLAVCSTQGPPQSKSAPQASMLTQLSHDTGKYSNEYLFSTDNALFGWRGLWNFGPDPRYTRDVPPPLSLLSAGAEAYYSPISSLIGMSTGLRFTTLPAATEIPPSSSPSSTRTPISTFPYTLTLTLAPIVGSLSTTYSLRASPNLAFSSRFGFNVYSWESEMVAGCELWRRTKKSDSSNDEDLEWARRKMRMHDFGVSLPGSPASPLLEDPARPEGPVSSNAHTEAETSDSVIKLRIDQSWNVRLLWEGRVKELLVSAGVGLGPGSFSLSPSVSSASGSGSAQSGGGPGMSYWRGVGVSVLYSS